VTVVFSDDVFFHNPGPTNIPSSVLEAMRRPVIDYRGAVFREIMAECLEGLGRVLGTSQSVVIVPATGHGAWETALVNLFSPGDALLSLSIGYFGEAWADYAARLGLLPEKLPSDPRAGVDYAALEERLRRDDSHTIKGLLVTHCETSTGVMTDISEVRRILDGTGHPALLLVDVISSLACAEFGMDACGVDVTVGACQKGLMMPAGLCFLGISAKALEASRSARLPRAYWDWGQMLVAGWQANFPGTAPVQMFYGLREALRLIADEDLSNVIKRHARHAAAAQATVCRWAEGGDVALFGPVETSSPSVTTIALAEGISAQAIRDTALGQFKVQLAGGIGELRDRVIRIGHMGKLHAAQLFGVLAAMEMSMAVLGMRYGHGGIQIAMDRLADAARHP